MGAVIAAITYQYDIILVPHKLMCIGIAICLNYPITTIYSNFKSKCGSNYQYDIPLSLKIKHSNSS